MRLWKTCFIEIYNQTYNVKLKKDFRYFDTRHFYASLIAGFNAVRSAIKSNRFTKLYSLWGILFRHRSATDNLG